MNSPEVMQMKAAQSVQTALEAKLTHRGVSLVVGTQELMLWQAEYAAIWREKGWEVHFDQSWIYRLMGLREIQITPAPVVEQLDFEGQEPA